jgi:hypothetical protein
VTFAFGVTTVPCLLTLDCGALVTFSDWLPPFSDALSPRSGANVFPMLWNALCGLVLLGGVLPIAALEALGRGLLEDTLSLLGRGSVLLGLGLLLLGRALGFLAGVLSLLGRVLGFLRGVLSLLWHGVGLLGLLGDASGLLEGVWQSASVALLLLVVPLVTRRGCELAPVILLRTGRGGRNFL